MKIRLTNKLISEIGVKEKYVRVNHYNTIKVWWARRPITSMRSLLVKEMLLRTKEENLIDSKLVTELNPSLKTFSDFKNRFNSNDLKVLDVFAGGGSIPFESGRLGFQTYSSELNPVASLLQEAIFNSMKIENFAEIVSSISYEIIENVEKKLAKFFFVANETPYVIFWSKVAKCKNCNENVDLRRLKYLSKRIKKPIRIVEKGNNLELAYDFLNESDELAKSFRCKKCGYINTFKDIKDFCKNNKFAHSPFAICYNDSKKRYKILSKIEKQEILNNSQEIEKRINELRHLIPSGSVVSKSGVINPTIYDLKIPEDFFNRRQLLVLLTIINEIIQSYTSYLLKQGKEISIQITLALTSLIEFLVDWNSVSTMWISQNEQTGRSLAGPGVGMKWDYIEINPFYLKGSNLKSKIDRVCKTLNAIKFNNQINILKGSSCKLKLENESIDIVLTDPPYYDSIDYTALSDFFRPWFEILVGQTYSANINLKNEDQFEAIVELSNNSKKDHNHYQKIMTDVLKESKRVLKIDGSILLLFSHKTFEGWKVIADSFYSSKLFVSSCIPLEMERIARPRAMSYDALNGVITFRLIKDPKNISSVEDDLNNMKKMLLDGELLESQLVIYLASLAVKQVSLTGFNFIDAYSEIIRKYDKIRLNNWVNGNMDSITKLYLNARVIEKNISESQLADLEKFDLIINGKLANLDQIIPNEKISKTILESALKIYKDLKNSSKTKIEYNLKEKDNLITFYSIINGLELNSVSNRSNTNDTKAARLILSKFQ